MRILITGGTGFIGQNMVGKLSEEISDGEILLSSRSISSAKEKLSLDKYSNIRVAESNEWDSVVKFNPDVVIHLAALCTSRNDSEIVDSLIDSNIVYGIHLLDALKQCPSLKLFINTGSFAEFYHGPQTFDNAYLYSATKTAYRSFVDYYAKLCGYKYITAIPYTVYGGKRTVKRILDYMMDALGAPTPVDMTAGEQILDFVHVDDVANFYIQACKNLTEFSSLPQGQDFYIGTGRGYSLREVAVELESITGKTLNINWGAREYRDRDTMYSVAPISSNPLQSLWKSRINLHEGLERFVGFQCKNKI